MSAKASIEAVIKRAQEGLSYCEFQVEDNASVAIGVNSYGEPGYYVSGRWFVSEEDVERQITEDQEREKDV